MGTTDSHVDERDKSEISESTSETVTTPWEAESEDDLESNPSVLEKNIETEEPDYVDYSYAEIAAQEKTSGEDSRVEDSRVEYQRTIIERL